MTSTSSRTHRSPSPSRSLTRTRTWDDLTLGKMLTEAYRGQVDYFVQEGVSVSQLSSSVRSDRSGQLDGEIFDRSGNLMSVTARKHRLGLYLRSKDRQFLRSVTQESSRTPSSSSRRRAPTPSRTIMATEIGNFVNLRVLHSTLWQDENSLRIRTLSCNYEAEYRNCKMK